jgi:anti-anti-sigma factor
VSEQDDTALEIERDDRGRTAVVTVVGEVDVTTGAALRVALGEALNDPAIDDVVADLRSVSFLSSTGIATLVDAHGEARHHGKVLTVAVGDSRAVSRPLLVAGVDKILNLDADLRG